MARAVYARKQFIILDDVFSGLDAETEDQVFGRLFGTDGLLRKLRTTVLVATHAIHRLPVSDYIVALDSSGHVVEQGHFEQLRSSGKYVEELSMKLRLSDESAAKEQPEAAKLDVSAFKAGHEELDARTEELSRQSGDLSVYKYYFASIGWQHTIIFWVLVVLYGVTLKLPELMVTYCKSRMLFITLLIYSICNA